MAEADKKKDKQKEKPVGWGFNEVEWLIVLLIFVTILSTVVPKFLNFINSGDLSFYGLRLSSVADFFKSHIQFLKTLGFGIAGVSAVATFIFIKKGDAVWREEKAKLYPENMPKSFSGKNEPLKNPVTDKWNKIVTLSQSTNQSDWRLCIIEADIMLDDLLDQLQLPGETMGEKLKAVEKSDFLTIDSAWEAHKARNMIAHEGNDFLLNQREVRRIISLYESVFKEFHII